MSRNELKRRLQNEPDRYELEYRARPLAPVRERGGTASRAAWLPMIVAGVVGAAVALALVALSRPGVLGPAQPGSASVSPRAEAPPCRSTDFNIRPEPWPAAPMAGGVLVIFEAREDTWCVVEQGIYTHVQDANGSNAVVVMAGVGRVEVTPGSAWQLGVYWSSYCGTGGDSGPAPARPARPLQLSVAVAISGEPVGGDPAYVADTLVPVATEGEIAPGPCTDEQPRAPFWLAPTGLEPYPGPAPSVAITRQDTATEFIDHRMAAVWEVMELGNARGGLSNEPSAELDAAVRALTEWTAEEFAWLDTHPPSECYEDAWRFWYAIVERYARAAEVAAEYARSGAETTLREFRASLSEADRALMTEAPPVNC